MTTEPPMSDEVRAFRADIEALHKKVHAFRDRYLRMRGRQRILQSLTSGLCIALVVDAVMNDSIARAVLAGAAVVAVNFLPILPRNPTVLFEGKE